ncbi:uncharacterized protein LOC126327200 [Schistocerca gregaria]|uniref:uncharacterized protein LOC126327200 n=1 Tax=Schistocerca gregaria TaxID=7010 RepID=UPI00211ED2AB|nr:uncharacterized protein LOC126327200 [Schistocerca gregaria]
MTSFAFNYLEAVSCQNNDLLADLTKYFTSTSSIFLYSAVLLAVILLLFGLYAIKTVGARQYSKPQKGGGDRSLLLDATWVVLIVSLVFFLSCVLYAVSNVLMYRSLKNVTQSADDLYATIKLQVRDVTSISALLRSLGTSLTESYGELMNQKDGLVNEFMNRTADVLSATREVQSALEDAKDSGLGAILDTTELENNLSKLEKIVVDSQKSVETFNNMKFPDVCDFRDLINDYASLVENVSAEHIFQRVDPFMGYVTSGPLIYLIVVQVIVGLALVIMSIRIFCKNTRHSFSMTVSVIWTILFLFFSALIYLSIPLFLNIIASQCQGRREAIISSVQCLLNTLNEYTITNAPSVAPIVNRIVVEISSDVPRLLDNKNKNLTILELYNLDFLSLLSEGSSTPITVALENGKLQAVSMIDTLVAELKSVRELMPSENTNATYFICPSNPPEISSSCDALNKKIALLYTSISNLGALSDQVELLSNYVSSFFDSTLNALTDFDTAMNQHPSLRFGWISTAYSGSDYFCVNLYMHLIINISCYSLLLVMTYIMTLFSIVWSLRPDNDLPLDERSPPAPHIHM